MNRVAPLKLEISLIVLMYIYIIFLYIHNIYLYAYIDEHFILIFCNLIFKGIQIDAIYPLLLSVSLQLVKSDFCILMKFMNHLIKMLLSRNFEGDKQKLTPTLKWGGRIKWLMTLRIFPQHLFQVIFIVIELPLLLSIDLFIYPAATTRSSIHCKEYKDQPLYTDCHLAS